MDDDKQDKAGATPGGDAGKRKPPTIDLEASNVTDTSRASETSGTADSVASESVVNDSATSESISDSGSSDSVSPASPVSRSSSLLFSAMAGAATAVLVFGAAKFGGLLDAPPPVAPPVTNTASKSDVEAIGARIAKIESDAAKPIPAPRPVTDPAIATRLETIEKSLTSLRADVVAARGQSEKVAAALGELKSAQPQAVVTTEAQTTSVIETAAIEERIGKIERATAALSAAAAAPQPPPEDPRVRKVAAATVLDSSVRQGEPYAPALAAARSAADDTNALKPLDAFAATGIPSASALCRELLALLPKLAPKSETAPAPSGMVERLQQSAAKLVRVQRTDAPASSATAALARVTAAAQRDDVAEAKRELLQVPAQDRVSAQAWIDKVDARDVALAASRQFVSDTMTALSKPAR